MHICIISLRYGEAPRAYVVMEPGYDFEASREDILNYVEENAAPYKRLAGGAEAVEAIPKSAAGKIQRKLLLDKYKRENNIV